MLTFKAAPDFEAPTDAGANNVYDVQVTATDNGTGTLTDVQDLTVTVTDEVEGAPPVVDTSKVVIVPEDEGPVALGILAPTDTETAQASLTIKVTEVPTAGTVNMADGTAVLQDDTLSVDELKGLTFSAGTVSADTTESFTYSVTDGDNRSTTGTVTLTVNDTSTVTTEIFTGGAGNDILMGGDGDDKLTGGAGNDTYYASEGHDEIHAGTGTDTLVFTDGADGSAKIVDADGDGNVDDLRITGDGKPFTIDVIDHTDGEALTNVKFPDDGQMSEYYLADSFDTSANAADTIMVGTDSAETMKTGSGDDIIVGNAGADIITSGDGDDEIHYDAADTSVDAGAGYDMLSTGDVPGDPTSVDLRTSSTPPTITNIEEIDLNEGLDLVIGTKMVFDATANSIQILDVAGNAVNGIFWDLQDGDSFQVTGATTAANNGTYEIKTNGRVDNGSKILVKQSV